MHLARGLSSKLIIPPCVRPSVRPCVPLLGEAQNLCFCTILSEMRPSPSKHLIKLVLFCQMLKTHHNMIGRNREFQYLPAKIIAKIVKYQYFPAKTIHSSLSHLTLSSLSHIPLSPLFSWLRFHSQSLSVTLGQPLFEFILMPLARGLSSKLLIPPCVRASVRASPSSGKLKTYAFAPYCLKFQKITYVFYST